MCVLDNEFADNYDLLHNCFLFFFFPFFFFCFIAVTAFNPIALRKAKIVYNFGLSECNRVERGPHKRLVSTILKCVLPSVNKVYYCSLFLGLCFRLQGRYSIHNFCYYYSAVFPRERVFCVLTR